MGAVDACALQMYLFFSLHLQLVHHHNQKVFFCYTAIHSEMVININTHL